MFAVVSFSNFTMMTSMLLLELVSPLHFYLYFKINSISYMSFLNCRYVDDIF